MIDRKKSSRILSLLRTRYGSVAPALEYQNIFGLTIAVVLSAQTTDRQVNAVTPVLFSKYSDFRSLSEAKVSEVEKIIQSTGFFHSKARHIIALAKMVVSDFGGTLPSDRNMLMTLPGVGRKSANVILSQGFGIPALAVDTHVGRVARRIGYTKEHDPDRVESSLCTVIPERDWTEAHLLFITHGRTLCAARNPSCAQCPIARLCAFPDKVS
jgi:endonuclease-3